MILFDCYKKRIKIFYIDHFSFLDKFMQYVTQVIILTKFCQSKQYFLESIGLLRKQLDRNLQPFGSYG